ncbi:MAG: HAD family hydrolase [bacterium]|nr:HAD family hydrolase [bacterium]
MRTPSEKTHENSDVVQTTFGFALNFDEDPPDSSLGIPHNNQQSAVIDLSSEIVTAGSSSARFSSQLFLIPQERLIVLTPNEELVIMGAKVAGFDFDETLVLGTGKHFHDGENARFAGGLERATRNLGISFDRTNWSNYSQHAGLSEKDLIARLAIGIYKEHGVFICPRHIKNAVDAHADENFHELLGNVSVAGGALTALTGARSSGARVAVCTASSVYIQKVLEYFDLYEHFDYCQYDAPKKNWNAQFSGGPIEKMCAYLGESVENSVFIGDGISDVASHKLAGGLATVLYCPDPARLDRKLSEIEAFRVQAPTSANNGFIYVVSNLAQVVFKAGEGNLSHQVQYKEAA